MAASLDRSWLFIPLYQVSVKQGGLDINMYVRKLGLSSNHTNFFKYVKDNGEYETTIQ